MKRRFLTAAIGITMALSLAACGSQTNTQNNSAAESSTFTTSSAEAETSTDSGATESPASESTETTENIDGGWEINQGSLDPDASENKAAKEAFEKATAELTDMIMNWSLILAQRLSPERIILICAKEPLSIRMRSRNM